MPVKDAVEAPADQLGVDFEGGPGGLMAEMVSEGLLDKVLQGLHTWSVAISKPAAAA